MASTLANLKTTIEKTKSKILAKGEADADDYFQEKEKALFLEQVLLRINKRTKKSLELSQELTRLQNEIVGDIHGMYASDDPMHTTVLLMKEAASNGDVERQKMAERLDRNSIRPVDDYCLLFKEIKKRMEEYTARRTEMEKLKAELTKIQEKGPSIKLPGAEERYKMAYQKYEELREELLRDLPALNEDRTNILGYVLACSLRSQSDFYSSQAEKYSVISSLVTPIDQNAVLHHRKAITSAETSAAAINLRAHPIFNKGDTTKQSTQTPPKSGPPPSTTPVTQPPPQQQVQPTYTLHKMSTPNGPTEVETVPAANPFNNPPPSYTPAPASAPLVDTSSTPTPQEPAGDSPAILKNPIKAKGLYDFTATEDNELSFKKGDVLTIVAKHGDWWEGELNGSAGLLPSNYVTEI